jgi:hypothetical protein
MMITAIPLGLAYMLTYGEVRTFVFLSRNVFPGMFSLSVCLNGMVLGVRSSQWEIMTIFAA